MCVYMNKNVRLSVSVSPNETVSKSMTIWVRVCMSTTMSGGMSLIELG